MHMLMLAVFYTPLGHNFFSVKVQHKRKAYEEMTKQHGVVHKNVYSPLSKSSVQWMKWKPRAKPDSFILLDFEIAELDL